MPRQYFEVHGEHDRTERELSMSSKRPVPLDHQRPETYPVYHSVAKVAPSGGGGSVVLGLKNTGLDVYFDDGEILHYDLQGRLLRVARPNVQWRRGLSGRTIKLRRRTREEGGGLERCHLTRAEADRQLEAANSRLRDVLRAYRPKRFGQASRPQREKHEQERLELIAARAASFDLRAAYRDLAQFRALYHDIPVLPPDQYASLVLLASDGCRYNRCTFCGLYRDTIYRSRGVEEFRAGVDQAVSYHGDGLALRRGIFLGQANALMGSPAWREQILRSVNERFELPSPDQSNVGPRWWQGSRTRFNGITSFLDAFIGTRIGTEEFAAMRQLNLRQVFIGMETGDEGLLEWLRKPARPEQMLETVRAARQGGVRAGVIVLVGAGGERFFDPHVRNYRFDSRDATGQR